MEKEGMNCEKSVAYIVCIQKIAVRQHEVGTSDNSLGYCPCNTWCFFLVNRLSHGHGCLSSFLFVFLSSSSQLICKFSGSSWCVMNIP